MITAYSIYDTKVNDFISQLLHQKRQFSVTYQDDLAIFTY